MRKFIKRYAPVVALLTLLLMPSLTTVASSDDALSANKLSIKPPYMSITTKQGGSFKQKIQLFHATESEETITLEARVRDVRRMGDQIIYLDEFNLDDPAYSVSKWSAVEPEPKIKLPPNKWVTITVRVNVPEDAELGEHIAVINVRTVADSELSGTGMQVVTSLSPAFFVLVTDPEGHYALHRQWSLDEVRGKKWNGGDFTATITNSGNVHVLTQTNYRIVDWWSNETVEESVMPLTSILAGNSREVELKWPQPKRLGLFRAEIEISAVQDDHLESYQTWFVRIPTLALVIMLATFIIVFLLVQLYIRRSIEKKIEQSSKNKAE